MSISKMQSIFGNRKKGLPGSRHQGNARLLMLAIADNSGDDGYCFPSIPELAFKTGLSERSIIRLIPKLEETGELYVEHNRGRKNSNEYIVTLDMTAAEISTTLQKHFDYTSEEAELIASFVTEKVTESHVLGKQKGDTLSPFNNKKRDSVSKNVTLCPKKVTESHPNHHEPSIITVNKDKKILTPSQQMFLALAKLCEYDLELITSKPRGKLNQTEKKLRDAGISPSELLDGFKTWWYDNDWRGKKGQPPTPSQVIETWGQYKNRNGENIDDKDTRPRIHESTLAAYTDRSRK